MTEFFLIAAVLYLLIHLYIFSGLLKSFNLKKNKELPAFVSVIVAARNEKDNIVQCINSLKMLTYHEEKFEIILVNDKSTDDTKELMLEHTKGLPQFVVIDSRSTESTNLKGKANAIDTAIEISKGEIIMTSDADCVISKNWITETVSYYDDKTGMVCGFTNIKSDKSLFEKVQAIDWVYLLSLASGSSGINQTLSCIGNNLSFRKSAYNDVGGYNGIDFSITEDFALMRAIHKLKKYKIKYPVNYQSVVWTEACRDFKTLYKQKKRWFKGGLKINLLGYCMGFELYSMNLALFFGWIFLPLPIYLLIILIKFISELFMIVPVMKRLNLIKLLEYYIFFEIYFALYGLLLPLTFITGHKIEWKDRKF
jgi:cellulose synthase/poly-beta-1,6-N-acetylglucosamine synthase-like glycosyltransferase